MGKTVAAWETYFEQLSPQFLIDVINALETLQKAEMVFTEYEWTGLFYLRTIATEIERKREYRPEYRKKKECIVCGKEVTARYVPAEDNFRLTCGCGKTTAPMLAFNKWDRVKDEEEVSE